MNKLLYTLLAGASALALSGGAFAADQAVRDTGTNAQNQTQGDPADQAGTDRKNSETSRDSEAGRDATVNNEGRAAGRESPEDQTTGTVNQGGEDVTAEGRDPVKQEYETKPEYQAELKKCDDMTGSQKETCIDAAKKKHSQM